MYDDDLYSNFLNSLGSTLTTDEDSNNSDSSSSYNPSYSNTSTDTYNPYSTTDYQDDYSVTPNYESQQSYESNRQFDAPEPQTQRVVSSMQTPIIKRAEPAVVLTKTRQKIYLQARMKIILAMFVTIVCSLLFVSVFNFINVSRINTSIADKQITIEELQASITSLQSEYNLVSDDGNVKELALEAGYVETSDSNTTELSIGETYTEPVVEDLPSNWFNDVCDFLSNLFAA